jgi:hypothetical protein
VGDRRWKYTMKIDHAMFDIHGSISNEGQNYSLLNPRGSIPRALPRLRHTGGSRYPGGPTGFRVKHGMTDQNRRRYAAASRGEVRSDAARFPATVASSRLPARQWILSPRHCYTSRYYTWEYNSADCGNAVPYCAAQFALLIFLGNVPHFRVGFTQGAIRFASETGIQLISLRDMLAR